MPPHPKEMLPKTPYEAFLFIIFRAILGLVLGTILLFIIVVYIASNFALLTLFQKGVLLAVWIVCVAVCSLFPYALMRFLSTIFGCDSWPYKKD